LSKSPYIILSISARAITCMRLVDNVVTRVHADFVRKYTAKDPMFLNLPLETHAILGQPLTEESLIKLAKSDQLDILYLDKLPTKVRKARTERPATRAHVLAEQRKILEDAMLDINQDDNTDTNHIDTDSDSEDDNHNSSTRKVHFK
jgi:hypothetical protein